MSVLCIAKFSAKDNSLDRLQHELENLIAPSRQEPGCIQYNLFRDQKSPNILTMVEIFSDKFSFESHQETEHISLLKKSLPDLIDNVDVTVHDLVK